MVDLECLSPDKKMTAVVWNWMGGGAAYQYVSVIPAHMRADEVLKKETIADGLALRFSHANNMILTWSNNQTLIVDYPDSAVVHYASPGGNYTPLTPNLKVIHRGVPGSSDGTLPDGSQCKSGTGR